MMAPDDVLVVQVDSVVHAWVGVEVVALRDLANEPSWRASLNDEALLIDRTNISLVNEACGLGASVALDLRFVRSPQHGRLRAAVLGRVTERTAAEAVGKAGRLANVISRFPSIRLAPLPSTSLPEWLRTVDRRPEWAVTACRRIAGRLAPSGDDEQVRPILVTASDWDRLLDRLAAAPNTFLSVRVSPAPDHRHRTEVDRLVTSLAGRSKTRFNAAASDLGVTLSRGPDHNAASALEHATKLQRLQTGRAFRFRVEMGGLGRPSRDLIELLDQFARPGEPEVSFGASALDVRAVSGTALAGLDQDLQNLSLYEVETLPPRPANMASLASTIEEAELATLLHIPRHAPQRTPGFRSDLDEFESTGSPARPFVFISYARADRNRANEVVRLLKGWDVEYWWDSRLLPGDDIGERIATMLDHPLCKAVVAVVSPQSDARAWVTEELRRAMKRGLPLIQVLVDSGLPLIPNLLAMPFDSIAPNERLQEAIMDALRRP